MEEISYYLI